MKGTHLIHTAGSFLATGWLQRDDELGGSISGQDTGIKGLTQQNYGVADRPRSQP